MAFPRYSRFMYKNRRQVF